MEETILGRLIRVFFCRPPLFPLCLLPGLFNYHLSAQICTNYSGVQVGRVEVPEIGARARESTKQKTLHQSTNQSVRTGSQSTSLYNNNVVLPVTVVLPMRTKRMRHSLDQWLDNWRMLLADGGDHSGDRAGDDGGDGDACSDLNGACWPHIQLKGEREREREK